METLKKHIEIFRINRQISSVNQELADSEPRPFFISGFFYQPHQPSQSRYVPESERTVLLRECVAALNARKEELRRG